MKATVGVLKEIDKLGRLVIPKEFRERFAITDRVEIIATEQGIMLRNPEYKLTKIERTQLLKQGEDRSNQ